MSQYILYPANSNLYSKASLDADPWNSDATDLTEVGTDGLYEVDSAAPYIFVGTAAAAASTDVSVGTVGDFFYGSVSAGDLYMLQRLHAIDWNGSATFDKVRALYHAKTVIDKFQFVGSKIESSQNLEFPRQCVASDGTITTVASGAIPTDIEEAAYLIADALLSGRDPEEDFESQLVKVETFGPVRTEYATDKGPMNHISNMIPSPAAWARIQPWLRISSSFDLKHG